MNNNIAIDGPAGAGKSTIAKRAAKELGYIYVDTGSMYRAMALYFVRDGISGDDEQAVSEACEYIDISIEYVDGEQVVLLNGENVNSLIRTEQIGKMTSDTSKYKTVRKKLLDIQRGLAVRNNVIMDGRDIGTCVLPDAKTKIYLTASAEKRAERRYKELSEKGVSCEIDQIKKDIIARDEQDMNRAIAPLRQAEDAVYLDTSDMTIDEVVKEIIKIHLR